MKSFQIRQKFLEFFEKNGHTIVPGSSLIPAQDPTLLFVNAGMNQFKDIFLGKEKRSYTRATSSQKCMRAGGKHNDLDQVGLTARHCTFFEMLGNFSFGDYFKKEAIQFAWTFLTKEIGIPAEKLFVTVFQKDDDAYDLWHKVIGLEKDRITRLGEKDNFWQMGDTGPCGPCSEIYFDLGEAVGCKSKTCAPGCDCPRFIEIWNLVFMQYNRQTDGTLSPLKSTGVDTGMGLERLCLVLQNAPTVFDTDLFAEIIKKTEQIVGINYESADDKIKIPFRVLAEHTRSVSLLIADGCSPSNDGRGYVLRKIIRRAALFAQKLSNDQSLLPQ
jgi:alanyl-tRNA synthetase